MGLAVLVIAPGTYGQTEEDPIYRAAGTPLPVVVGDTLGVRCDNATFLAFLENMLDNGLQDTAVRCQEQVRTLTYMRFGPPSDYEQKLAVCSGHCLDYHMRLQRLLIESDETGPACSCSTMRERGYHYFHCYTPLDYLCQITGFCFSYLEYWSDFCEADSCARYIDNENDFIAKRSTCGACETAASVGAGLLVVGAMALREWTQDREEEEDDASMVEDSAGSDGGTHEGREGAGGPTTGR